MDLPEGLWLRHMRYDPARVDAWWSLLSADESARYSSFPTEERQREFLLGRVALRTLLSDQFGGPPENFVLQVSDAGAPMVEGHPVHVSLTHSDDRAVAVIANVPVGVDLEPVTERPEAVHRFLLRPDEYALLETLPMEPDAAFILCWTLKEATLKAMGTGLSCSPKNVRLEIEPSSGVAEATAEDGSNWHLRYEKADDFFLSVAFPERESR